ncbi:MAG: DHA2 family efflux MFS transporter permease subunit [Polyangia bacterium]
MSSPRPPVNKWLVTLSVTFGTLMGTIDASIVNVALPHIRGAVGATLEEITWITTGFVVANVIVMPLTGFLSRMFGQKRVYLTSLVVFLIGSVLCGTAHSLTTLTAFRVLQGLGAGALQPTEQAILRRTFPPHEQGMAMAVFGMAVVLGPAAGPTLGGFIVDHYSWPWIFFINLPVGALGFLMVTTFVHEDEEIRRANHAQAEREKKNVDWLGIALLALGLALIQYALEEGQRNDWFESRVISSCFALGSIALVAFVIRELTAATPAVDLRLFKERTFLSATLIGGVQFAILMANIFLLPIFMQEMLGYTAMDTGLALLPRAAIMFVVNPIVGKLYGKISVRWLVGTGVVLVSLGSFIMSAFTLQTSLGQIVVATLIQGIGFSCLFIPLAAAALTYIPKHRLADAAGLNSLFRQLGGSIGLAVFATLLTRAGTIARNGLIAHVTDVRGVVAGRLAQITAGLGARGLDHASAQSGAYKALAGLVFGQSMTIAFERTFFLAGVVFLVVLPLLYFLRITRRGGSSEQARHGGSPAEAPAAHAEPSALVHLE